MAMLPSAFNTKGQEEMGDFSAIPGGEYLAAIVKSEMKLTKKAKEEEDPSLGQILNLQFKILNGEHKGRVFFRGLNLINQNETAVEIAQKELTSICKAVGKVVIQNSDELHNIPMMVKLIVKEPSEQEKKQGYSDPKNEVRKYWAPDGAVMSSSSGEDSGESKPKSKKNLF